MPVPVRIAARRGRTDAGASVASPPWARTVAPAAVCLGFFVIQLDATIVERRSARHSGRHRRDRGRAAVGHRRLLARQRPPDRPLRAAAANDRRTRPGGSRAALVSTAGAGTPLGLLLAGFVLIGLRSLAMPAMTAVVIGSAGSRHAGVASGVLNAARQAGGALGVALLGSLLAGGSPGGPGLSLQAPLRVAAAGYAVAVGLAWLATRSRQ
jgi:hypothetical protein